MIKIQDWIVIHLNITASQITKDTLLIQYEVTGTYLYLFIFGILWYYYLLLKIS